jgi:hypothetical protein
MLEPLFQRHGLYGPTQAALWLACMRVGGKPLDGITADAPEGLTVVSGKWCDALAMRLSTGDLGCQVKMARDGRRSVLEKLVFVSSYNLVGACYGGITVGEVAKKHSNEVNTVARELASFIRYTLAVSLFSGLDDRLAVARQRLAPACALARLVNPTREVARACMSQAYAEKMEFMPTSIRDFEFRTPCAGDPTMEGALLRLSGSRLTPAGNGYFYKYAKMAGTRTNPAGIKVRSCHPMCGAACAMCCVTAMLLVWVGVHGAQVEIPDTTPVHTDYLMLAQEKGVISQALLDSV